MKKGAIFLVLLCCACIANGYDHIRKDGYNIRDFGAVSDGKTINTKFIQMAIDKCFADGGGEVIIPNGVFRTGTVYLKHNVAIYLDPSAVLNGSTDKIDYADSALIVALEQNNIGVYGRGTINSCLLLVICC